LCIGGRYADGRLINMLTPAPTVRTRRRLWKAGAGVALFILTLAIGNAMLPPERALRFDGVGLDFIAFYTAGTFVAEGRSADLYNLDAVIAYQRQLAEAAGSDLGGGFGPWWNPPFYALLFVPLAMLPFSVALKIWVGINLACIAGAIAILCRMLRNDSARGETRSACDWRTWGLVPLLLCTSMPFLLTLSHGQNTGMSLLILAAAVALWRADRALLAGMVAGLLFYKPQLAAVAAAVLTISLGRRALLGLGITGTALLLINVIALPGTLENFLVQMPANLHVAQVERKYMWERHVTLTAFWRLLIQGFEPGEMAMLTRGLIAATSLAVFGGLGLVLWKARGRRDETIVAAILAMPLLMPFYFDYDLLLLGVAAVLQARIVLTRGAYPSPQPSGQGERERSARWMVGLWVGLFFWLMLAHHVAPVTRVNLTAPILGAMFFLAVRQALRSERIVEIPQRFGRPLARAA
jgi:alpha-1,2-mannosyltransferase